MADAFSIDVGKASGDAPTMEIDQALMSVWPLDIIERFVCPAQIQDVIAGMIDGSIDKAGVSEHFIGVVMTDEVASPAVRDDDERQVLVRPSDNPSPPASDLAEINRSGGWAQGYVRGST